MKILHHHQNEYTKEQVIGMMSESQHVTIISVNSSYFLNTEGTQKDVYRKHPASTISKSHLFKRHLSNPAFTILKSLSTATEEAACDLAKGNIVRTFMSNNSPVPECIKETLNPNAMTMQDLIDDNNPPLYPPRRLSS